MSRRVHVFFPKNEGERAVVESMRRDGLLAVGSAMTSAMAFRGNGSDGDDAGECGDDDDGDLEKGFNKDQKRDENGRFAAMGGGVSRDPMTPEQKFEAVRIKQAIDEKYSDAAAKYVSSLAAVKPELVEIRQNLLSLYAEKGREISSIQHEIDRHSKAIESASKKSLDAIHKFARSKFRSSKISDMQISVAAREWWASQEGRRHAGLISSLNSKSDSLTAMHANAVRGANDSLEKHLHITPANSAAIFPSYGSEHEASKLNESLSDPLSHAKPVTSSDVREWIERGAAFLRSMAHSSVAEDSLDGVKFFECSGSSSLRGFAVEKNIVISSKSAFHVVVHEMAHLIEDGGRIKELCNGFLQSRCGDEVPHVISARNGEPVFGREDRFQDAFGRMAGYVGRYYRDGSTEVLAMGMQAMAAGSAAFAKKDPEFFDFVFGVISGRIK